MERIQDFLSSCEQASDNEALQDIIVNFCRNDGCGHLSALLNEETKRKPSELGTIFSCLEQLFLRISVLADVENLQAKVTSLAQNLIRNNLRMVYMTLSPSNSAVQVKAALRALTAAVSLNSYVARELATIFNFDDPVVFYVSDRRSRTDTPDCRTRYIQFLISFFLDEDNSVIRAILDRKNVIQTVLAGLVYDDAETVQLFLLALIEKVAQSSAVSKTQKVKVFNHGALDSLLKLYRWEGPTKFKGKDGGSKKKNAKADEDLEPSDEWKESRAAVAETVHELLVILCSSHKNGIAFCDFTLGTSGRNLNPLCWHVVQKCPRPWEDPKLSELVSKTLSACPDLLRFYFDELAPIAAPRAGQKWQVFAEFVEKIISSQNVNIVLSAHEHLGPKQLVNRATYLFILPSSLGNQVLRDSLVSEDTGVQTCGVKMALAVLKKASEFKSHLFSDKGASYSDVEKANVLKFLTEMVSKGMPYLDRYIACLTSQMSLLKKKETEIQPDEVDIFYLLLQLFGSSDTFLHAGASDLDAFYLNLLSDVIKIGNTEWLRSPEVQECWKKIQLEAINLVAASKTISSASLVTNKETGQHILQTIFSIYGATKDAVIKDRIFSMYSSFMGSEASVSAIELTVWMVASSSSIEAQEILAGASLKYLEDPSKYMSKLRQVVHGSTAEDSGLKNPLIEAMMEEDFDPAGFQSNTKSSTETSSISSFLFAVLEAAEEKLPEPFWDAVARVLLSVESNPDVFASIFAAALQSHCSNDVKNFVSAWTSKSETVAVDKKQKRRSTKKVVTNVEDYSKMVSAEKGSVFGLEELDSTTSTKSSEYSSLLVRQKLLYLRKASKLGGSKALDILNVLDGVLEEAVALENSDVLVDFLVNPTTIAQFIPFSSDNFVRQFVKIILKYLKPEVRSNYEKVLCQQLEKFIHGPLGREYLDQVDINLVNKAIEAVHISSDICASFLSSIAESLSAPSKTAVPLSIVALLLKQYALNRLENQEQRCLDASVFASACKCVWMELDSSNERREEGLKQMAIALKVFLTLYPSMFGQIPRSGNDEEDCFLANFLSFGSWSREREELGCLLLKLDQSKHYMKSFERTIAGVTDVNMDGKMQEEESDEINSNANGHYPRLFATYLRLKKDLGEKVDDPVAKDIRLLFASDVIQSISNPEAFSSYVDQTDGSFRDVYSYVVKNYSENEKLVSLLTNILGKKRPVHGDAILPFVDVAPHQLLLRLIFQSTALLCKTTISSNILAAHLTSYLTVIDHLPSTFADLDTILGEKVCTNFIKTCLKFGLRVQEASNEEEKEDVEKAKIAGGCLITLLNAVVEKVFGDSQSETLEQIYTMATSHSDFMPVMINDRDFHMRQKGSLLKLLLTVTKKNPKICKTVHIPVYLSSYHATLDPMDQLIFELLSSYESHGAYLQHYRPLLWGDPALSHSLAQRSEKTKLLSQESMQEVLSLLDVQLVKRLSENFPVNLRLEAYIDEDVDASLYDPRFLLQSFYHLLSLNELVPCQNFIQSGCLSLAFASLTSRDENMRSLGYAVLSRFYPHLETAKFYERPLWVNLMDSLQHSLSLIGSRRETKNLRLTSLIGVFLARAANIMTDPQNEMYKIVQNFLLVKPSLDIQQVPEFYVLFSSSEGDYKQRRKWILQLLRDGFREHNDYMISSKKKIFRILTTFYDSVLADEQSKVDVLEILLAASKITSVAHDLVRNRGILSWIESLINFPGKSSFARQQLLRFTELAAQLWKSCSRAEKERKENFTVEEELSESESDPDSDPENEFPVPKRRKTTKTVKMTESRQIDILNSTQWSGQLDSRFFKLIASLWIKNKNEIDFTVAEAVKILDVILEVTVKIQGVTSGKTLPEVVLKNFVRALVTDCRDLIGFAGDLVDLLNERIAQATETSSLLGSKLVDRSVASINSASISELLCESNDKQHVRAKMHDLIVVGF